MSRDATLERHDLWEGDEDARVSVLDRDFGIPLTAGRWIAAVAAIVVAVLLRFLGLDRFPLSVAEAEIALAANNIVRGETVPDDLHGMPSTIDWTALFFFGGNSADSVGRIAMATAGVLAILGILWCSNWIGGRNAAAAAFMAAASPTLVAASRRLDGGILLVALSVAIVGSVLHGRGRDTLAWPAIAGAATGLLVVAHPLGIPAAALAWIGNYLLDRPRQVARRDAMLAGLAAGIGTVVLATTALLSRPASFSASLGEVLGVLWSDHVSEIGTRWHMPAFNLILNEPIVIVLALLAGFASSERILVRSIATWFFTALIVISLLGDVGPAGYTIVALPLILLAGIGVVHLVDRLPWGMLRRGPATLYIGAILLMAIAVVSLLGLISGGVSDDTSDWLLRFALIVIVAILPLSFAISAIGSHVHGDRLALVLAAVLVLLSIVTVRSAVLAASERPVEPGDPLSAGAASESIPVIIERIEKLSRDTTLSQRSSLDPTGGHGLRIALDEQVAQPFAWYFREYPNLTVFDPGSEPVPLDAELVVLAGGRDSRTVAPGFAGQAYPYTTDTPETFSDPDWGGLLVGIVQPDELRRFADFMLNRNLDVEPVARQFQLLASAPLAEKLFPATGPFALSERPGAGMGQGQFNRPRGIAVAPDGSIFVVDSRNSRVQKFAPTIEFLLAFGSDGSGPGQLARFATSGGGGPNGIAIGDDGNVYVADTWNHRIQVFSPDGAYLNGWGTFFDAQDDPAQAATNVGLFYGPRGLAFHDSELYVTDTGNERVQVFTPDGGFVRMFGTTGSEAGNLLEPVGIAVAADGTILVADSHNARIARFESDGTPLKPWPVEARTGQTFFEPYLAIGSDGSVYASDSVNGTIVSFGPDGSPGATLGEGLVRQPFGVAVTSDGGSLLVTDGALHAAVTVPIPPN
ncbi:MAG: hypothetical protein WD628_05050 [Thermomicrobiales bacterium]